MKARAFIDEEKLITKAVTVLMKELSPAEAMRFLSLPRKKRLESVQRHRKWQAQLQKDAFFKRVFSKG